MIKRRKLTVEIGDRVRISVDAVELLIGVMCLFLSAGLIAGAFRWHDVLYFLKRCLPW
jgi:hypothetical protein